MLNYNFKRENVSSVKMYNIELLTCPVVTDRAFSTLGKDFRRIVRQQICLRNKSDGAPLSN